MQVPWYIWFKLYFIWAQWVMLLWYCPIAVVESVCVMSVRAAQLAVVLCIYCPFGCHPLGPLYNMGSNCHVVSRDFFDTYTSWVGAPPWTSVWCREDLTYTTVQFLLQSLILMIPSLPCCGHASTLCARSHARGVAISINNDVYWYTTFGHANLCLISAAYAQQLCKTFCVTLTLRWSRRLPSFADKYSFGNWSSDSYP